MLLLSATVVWVLRHFMELPAGRKFIRIFSITGISRARMSSARLYTTVEMDGNLEDDIRLEDDVDDAFEVTGLRGPLFGVVQNWLTLLARKAVLIIFILDTTIGVGIWLPFTLGKTTALLPLDPPRLFYILHLPIRAIRYVIDPVVDVITYVTSRTVVPLVVGASRLYWTALQRLVQFAVTKSGRKEQAWAEPRLASRGHEVRSGVVTARTGWVRMALGHGPHERVFAILLCYAVVGFVLALYLNYFTVRNARSAGRAVWMAVRQQLLVLKVAMFIIELIIFPLGCGIMLDVCTVWLFPEATIESRAAFFLHDKKFHPIRAILDRPTLTHIRKLLVPALMYSLVVASGVGSVATLLFVVSKSIFPDSMEDEASVRVWKQLASKLRPTLYMFGDRPRNEEVTVQYKTWPASFRRSVEDGVSVEISDEEYRRVPSSDNITLPKDMLDEEAAKLRAAQNTEEIKSKRNIEDFVVVYIPPQFRWRIICFILAGSIHDHPTSGSPTLLYLVRCAAPALPVLAFAVRFPTGSLSVTNVSSKSAWTALQWHKGPLEHNLHRKEGPHPLALLGLRRRLRDHVHHPVYVHLVVHVVKQAPRHLDVVQLQRMTAAGN
ncbi:hypothetical protein CONPUDRAFT_75404 [Coniophora puteana RWD-64-598 SS2]|uniref:RING-type E3 ubiquitin transferase n=1 Tax=Coniophora puteana (strain RWD-64-598) TaxID=741705 RepID=A0A5M3MFZ9_CONPW|nr:uncharacterized protein CONPUDRAFT_75404 [Coniophora puteana RWD-64-598 SS2]EIW77545.1 hypothetical protein CONPUDRAFT_75404 [Coniophora puteana RWD-64-598 SS2]